MDNYSGTEREIDWDEVSDARFNELLGFIDRSQPTWRYGVVFPTMPHRVNVQYHDSGFESKLKEKFSLLPPYLDAPQLVFVRHDPERFGFKLVRKHQGYVTADARKGFVFAGSFGMFKSAISGFASIQASREGYVPAHSSVFSINGYTVMFVGGSGAGKTTTLLRLVSKALADGADVQVLTDDWAVVKDDGQGSLLAESFDPSISLKQKDFLRSPDLRFYRHEELMQRVQEKTKVSLSPGDLFGAPVNGKCLRLDAIVFLRPVIGEPICSPVAVEDLGDIIVETAYHYPYVRPDEKMAHRAFWIRHAAQLRLLTFPTRNMNGDFQSLDALERLFYA